MRNKKTSILIGCVALSLSILFCFAENSVKCKKNILFELQRTNINAMADTDNPLNNNPDISKIIDSVDEMRHNIKNDARYMHCLCHKKMVPDDRCQPGSAVSFRQSCGNIPLSAVKENDVNPCQIYKTSCNTDNSDK